MAGKRLYAPAISGVAAFYRALHGAGTNPLFYVSSSPWNIYDMLSATFALKAFPAGPLSAPQLGLEGRFELRFGTTTIIRCTCTHSRNLPQLPFILIGDSGQEDPEIYREVVQRFPGRILTTYIRNVTPASATRTAVIQALARELQAQGNTLLLIDDTLGAARHAQTMGWISAADLGEVAVCNE
ncbi:MAG: phosphatase domain-containing protein [Kouleothrix sp.]